MFCRVVEVGHIREAERTRWTARGRGEIINDYKNNNKNNNNQNNNNQNNNNQYLTIKMKDSKQVR